MANPEVWRWSILAYYFVATFISIDKIIGRIYPLFGICLIVMAVGVIFGIFMNPNYTIPEIWTHFTNMHPAGKPIWSFMVITVAWCDGCRRCDRTDLGSSRMFYL